MLKNANLEQTDNILIGNLSKLPDQQVDDSKTSRMRIRYRKLESCIFCIRRGQYL